MNGFVVIGRAALQPSTFCVLFGVPLSALGLLAGRKGIEPGELRLDIAGTRMGRGVQQPVGRNDAVLADAADPVMPEGLSRPHVDELAAGAAEVDDQAPLHAAGVDDLLGHGGQVKANLRGLCSRDRYRNGHGHDQAGSRREDPDGSWLLEHPTPPAFARVLRETRWCWQCSSYCRGLQNGLEAIRKVFVVTRFIGFSCRHSAFCSPRTGVPATETLPRFGA